MKKARKAKRRQKKLKLERLQPTQSSDVEELADWLEVEALLCADRSASAQDLAQVLRAGGSTDATSSDAESAIESTESDVWATAPAGDVDHGSGEKPELTDSLLKATEALAEIERRRICAPTTYPFDVSASAICLRANIVPKSSIYLFQLALSLQNGVVFFAKKLPGPAVLFEEICLEAAANYIGPKAERLRFGAPRSIPNAKLKDAIAWLISRMGEGIGLRNSPISHERNLGDEGVDLVVWRGFADQRTSKLILFGQCAAGADWGEKLTELTPKEFADLHLLEAFHVEPTKSFFVPRHIPGTHWTRVSRKAGIVFDRSRISELAERISTNHQLWMIRAFASLAKSEGRVSIVS